MVHEWKLDLSPRSPDPDVLCYPQSLPKSCKAALRNLRQTLPSLPQSNMKLTSNCLVVIHALVTKSCPTLVTPWTVAHQAPLSMRFCRQEYWSGLPSPSPSLLDLPDLGIEPRSPALQADSFPTELQGKPAYPKISSQLRVTCSGIV